MTKQKLYSCLSIAVILLSLFGCSKPLAVVDTEAVEVDLTKELDPFKFFKEIKPGTSISYELDPENNVILFTLTRNSLTEVYEVPVIFKEPYYFIDEPIVFDIDNGFDILKYVETDSGTIISCDINREEGTILIRLMNGAWEKMVEKRIVFTSDPSFADSTISGTSRFDDMNELPSLTDETGETTNSQEPDQDWSGEENGSESEQNYDYGNDIISDDELPPVIDE